MSLTFSIQLQRKSFLSQHISELLKASRSTYSEDVLTQDGFLNWEVIDAKLNLSEYSRDTVLHKDILQNLSPAIKHVFDVYCKIPADQFNDTYGKYFEWTGNKQVFLEAFNMLGKSRCDVILATLMLTAGLERSLGNVYLLKGERVPYLLKDLLDTDELKLLVGNKHMALFDIIMGTPTSLNLRNIIWHGFLFPHEIDPRYGYFLIVLAMSLNEKLRNLNIVHRPFLNFEMCHRLQGIFPDFGKKESEVLLHVFLNSQLIVDSSKSFWETIVLKYNENRFGESLILLVTQVENVLRIIFAVANHCPQCVLTAEHDSRYITLTEIFSEFLEDGSRNLFANAVLHNEMELLLDIFMHPEGPRLRDRVSHGEVDVFNIPKYLVGHLFCLVALLCTRFLSGKDTVVQNDFVVELKKCSAAYQSIYHSSALLKEKVLILIESLKEWDTCNVVVPEILDPANVKPYPQLMKKCLCITSEFHNASCNGWSSFSEGLNKYKDLLINLTLTTVHRPKSESELVSLLRNIAQHTLQTSNNVVSALKHFYSSWCNKSLRSRQRDTYARLLSGLQVLYGGLRVVTTILVDLLCQLNHVSNRFQELVKMLKFVLKYVENLDAMTVIKVNKWSESVALTQEVLVKLNNFEKLKESHCDTT